MQENTCILVLHRNHRLNNEAIACVKSALNLKVIAYDDEINETKLSESKAKFLLNFLGSTIFKNEVLLMENVNFHPAPPQYPGRGSASLALYEGAAQFGATAHHMVESVDSGGILLTETFDIKPNNNCATLFSQAEQTCLTLLSTIVNYIQQHNTLPPVNSKIIWSKKAMSRAEFDQWLILNEKEPKEIFEKKIRAARHPVFPGPYIYIHGFKFVLANTTISEEQ